MNDSCYLYGDDYLKSKRIASKNPAVTAMQDLLFYQLTIIAFYTKRLLKFQKQDDKLISEITRLLYLTNKNINFKISTLFDGITQAHKLKDASEKSYKEIYKKTNKKIKKLPNWISIQAHSTLSQLVSQANIINAQKSAVFTNYKIYAMQEIIRTGLQACVTHLERIKSYTTIDKIFYKQLYDILSFLSLNEHKYEDYVKYSIKVGELNTQLAESLINIYRNEYGAPEAKNIRISHKKGHAILVCGDDIKFLKQLLEYTSNTEIQVYTYGALNYVHSFPEINKYKNLAGIYLGNQFNFAKDIENFPGTVVLTTGDIENLSAVFRGRIYSTEQISLMGISNIDENNIKKLIDSTLDAAGFDDDENDKFVTIGFSIEKIENFAEKYHNLMQKKEITNLNIILGCSTLSEEKKYFKKFIKDLPKTSALITINCLDNKIKISKSNEIKNMPKLLNMGAFINLYTLIRLLFAISGKFNKEIEEMPFNITLNLQNSASIATLLTLLSLGLKNIKITSELPNYITDAILNAYGNKYGIEKIQTNNNNPNDENKKFA